ncbi:MAG TPA: hypothetical protein VEU94_09845 [Terriglobales bacterium]|nr:hypothetical protein [Terriglobales bacterium]
MPVVSLFEELISGIEPTFVTRHDRLQLKHPISSIHRGKEQADPLKEGRRKHVRRTRMKPVGRLRIC